MMRWSPGSASSVASLRSSFGYKAGKPFPRLFPLVRESTMPPVKLLVRLRLLADCSRAMDVAVSISMPFLTATEGDTTSPPVPMPPVPMPVTGAGRGEEEEEVEELSPLVARQVE